MALHRAVRYVAPLTFLLLCFIPTVAPTGAEVSTAVDSRLPDAPHPDALIEWWYANAHVTTAHGRHLAVVCAFFKFGSAAQQASTGIPTSHYLIYAVTDLDRKSQHAYSYADSAMVGDLKKLLLMSGASDSKSISMLHALLKGRVPAPHRMITGKISIETSPLSVKYGNAGSFSAISGTDNAYRIVLGKGNDRVDLTLTSTKPVMKVGGTGKTGLVKPTDMYYYSLTRCNVAGDVDGDAVKSGGGWIDHQWGSSWTTQKFGWDWWGIQLDNGTDILVFQQRDLKTGKTFFPLATLMDKNGRLTVTQKIRFRPNPGSTWRSPRSHIAYPLAWTLTFPDQHLTLRVAADAKSQEIPILSPGGDIWEGSCSVSAAGPRKGRSGEVIDGGMYDHVHGTAYMELVGYSRTRARKQGR